MLNNKKLDALNIKPEVEVKKLQIVVKETEEKLEKLNTSIEEGIELLKRYPDDLAVSNDIKEDIQGVIRLQAHIASINNRIEKLSK